MGEQNSSGSTPFTVFDYLGLAFILPPPGVWVEALMRGQSLPSNAYMYAAIAVIVGALCIAVGRNWDNKLKGLSGPWLRVAVDYLSKSYVLLFVVFMLAVSSIVFAPLLLFPNEQPQKLNVKAVPPLLTSAPVASVTPIALSDDEKQFRVDLRKFVKTYVLNQGETFLNVSSPLTHLPNEVLNQKGPVYTAAVALHEASLDKYLDDFNILQQDASGTIDAIDTNKIWKDMSAYAHSYVQSQIYLLAFLTITNADPNTNGQVTNWLEADRKVDQAFAELISSPMSRPDGFGNGFTRIFPDLKTRLTAKAPATAP